MANFSDKFLDDSQSQGFTDFSAIARRNTKLLGMEQRYQKTLTELVKKSGLERLQNQLKNEKLSAQERVKIEEEIANTISKIENRAVDATLAYQENAYKKASIVKKTQLLADQSEAIRIAREEATKKFNIELSLAEGSDRQKLIAAQNKALVESINAENKLRERQREIEKSNQFKAVKAASASLNNIIRGDVKDGAAEVIGSVSKIRFKDVFDDLKKNADSARKEVERLEQQREELLEAEDSDEIFQLRLENEKKLAEARAEYEKAHYGEVFAKLSEGVSSAYNDAYKEAENMLTKYSASINARLQGTEKTFSSMSDMISSNLAISPFVRTKEVLEVMRRATDEGIAYNTEQRAFLETISDKIATTFDAFDSNLTRLIRLQQADTTAARLGMEASLTRLFNTMFQDSSYLNNMYDAVSSAIIDANSQLDRNASAEFEYVVQKWLGSLSSLGLSDTAVTNIATGINYLATGDVTSLANNNSLQTLFAMSASNAGLNYADLLLNGMNADNTNKLLASMVEYLKTIAENSDNQVVKAAYGDIFNMSMSDFRAISNLTSSDIANIAGTNLTYAGMQNEINNQLNQVISRTSLAEMMSNLYENAVFGVAQDMVNNPAMFAMRKMLDFMEKNEIDINIPSISVAGFGLDLEASVGDLMRMGLGIGSAMSLIGNILSGLGSGGGLNLDAWGGTEYTQRGSSMAATMGTLLGGTTGSTYVSTGSSTDMRNSTLNSATDSAQETAEITNKNSNPPEKSLDDFVGEQAPEYAKVKDVLIEKVFRQNIPALGVIDDTFIGKFNQVFGTRAVISTSGRLLVSDDTINRYANSQNELRVKDSGLNSLSNTFKSTTMNVRVINDNLLVKISNASDIGKAATQKVSLAPGTSVSIDKGTIVEAMREVMGSQDGKHTIQEMVDKLLEGQIQSIISGKVDTYLTGISSLVTQQLSNVRL